MSPSPLSFGAGITSGRRWSADTNLALRRDLSCQLIANGFPRFAGFVNLPHETDLAAQGNTEWAKPYVAHSFADIVLTLLMLAT